MVKDLDAFFQRMNELSKMGRSLCVCVKDLDAFIHRMNDGSVCGEST